MLKKKIDKCAGNSLEVYTMNRVYEMHKLYTLYKLYTMYKKYILCIKNSRKKK